MPKQVWWAALLERCVYDQAVDVMVKIAFRMGRLSVQYPENGWKPLYPHLVGLGVPGWQYLRTDVARQALAELFLLRTKNPDDTLVLLDIDHDHPTSVIELLVADDKEVVVPLMFRRGEPYQACAFRRGADGHLRHLATFPEGLLRMDALGAGAIAIQRGALEKLRAAGHKWFWKYEYSEEMEAPSEDLYFSKICEQAGVEMYVDTRWETPHTTLGQIDRHTHEAFMAENPDALGGLATGDGAAVSGIYTKELIDG